MRRGIFIAGLVLAVLGAGLLGAGLYASTIAVSTPQCAAFDTILMSGPVSVHWSGAAASTVVSVTQYSGGDCTGTPTANWTTTGSSGTVTFNAQPSSVYLFSQSGNSGLTITIVVGPITYLQLIGAALLVVGGALAGVGAGSRPKVRPEDAAAMGEQPSAAPPPPSSPAAANTWPANVPPPPPPGAPGAAAAAGAAAGVASPPPAVAPAAPVAPDTGRPPILCGYCGKWNEPWLTTCRYCKRPLMSTEST